MSGERDKRRLIASRESRERHPGVHPERRASKAGFRALWIETSGEGDPEETCEAIGGSRSRRHWAV